MEYIIVSKNCLLASKLVTSFIVGSDILSKYNMIISFNTRKIRFVYDTDNILVLLSKNMISAICYV